MTAFLSIALPIIAWAAMVAAAMYIAHRYELAVHASVSTTGPDGSPVRVLARADGEPLKPHDAMQYSTKVQAAPVIENRNFGR